MGQIKEGADILAASCAKCGHPKAHHLKATYHDEQRMNLKTVKRLDSECNICKKENKTCKQFKPKK